MKQDEFSTANQLWNAGATEVQQLNPDVHLKRSAKLLTVTGLTTKHAVCRITFMLYPILFNEWLFS